MRDTRAAWRSTMGAIANIQPYSIHDGPGIRTTVFLQGCPLGCWWCQNPETRLGRPQLFFDAAKCAGCGACIVACPHGAVSLIDGISQTDRARCDGAGACVAVCPSGARTMMGRRVAAGDVFDELSADAMFYAGGGGVTLSGGEPLAQPEFAGALLALCSDAGIHTTIDTTGYAPWAVVERLVGEVDHVLYDLKHMDSAAHRAATGLGNEIILENARRIHHGLHVSMAVRVPVVPGVNDGDDNIAATARFIASELDPSVPVHLIPYHALGTGKCEPLGLPARRTTPPDAEHLAAIRAVMVSFGLSVVVGGS